MQSLKYQILRVSNGSQIVSIINCSLSRLAKPGILFTEDEDDQRHRAFEPWKSKIASFLSFFCIFFTLDAVADSDLTLLAKNAIAFANWALGDVPAQVSQ